MHGIEASKLDRMGDRASGWTEEYMRKNCGLYIQIKYKRND